ncbi:MAG: 3-dehydroquinate synthase [Thermodesulfobacterium geofontis]|uniref:3-dehydroquinate synthase n=1 Tax=Thermodesulfobacterium geofontis TaxID=1295609 RepID=A0A2N7QEY2_9BACT|nr:MAG: 3-dehydroquinate synthase [Thermodesulfobacterium geofontis]
MKILKVKTQPSYEILIKENIFEEIPKDLKENFNFGKIAIITDSIVAKLYAERLLKSFQKAKIKAEVFSFPAGETSKNIDTVIFLARSLIQKNFDRKDIIVALGGGVVGDIAGFLASIYLRGIPYVQIPTTLLSQVDSSVGGKTGVDLPEGKNLIGTFYQPARVYIDPLVLKTLPEREVKNGLAEVIKYGCILKKRLFDFLKKRGKEIYKLELEDVKYIIYESCSAKAYVVSKDEKEKGLRRILNFGHTIGHAIETELNYSIPHGLAVSVGMVVEAKLSEVLEFAEKKVSEPLEKLLSSLEMPHKISHLSEKLSFKKLISHIRKDKKVWKGKLTMVLLYKIGKAGFYEFSSFEELESALFRISV